MDYRIAIEISAIQGHFALSRIIRSYKYSQYGVVAMILNGVSPRDVNKILDPIVPTLPLSIPGVKYIDIRAELPVVEAVSSARAILIQTPLFYEMVLCAGLCAGSSEQGSRRRIFSIPSAHDLGTLGGRNQLLTRQVNSDATDRIATKG